jgi:hypothetical protein
MYTPFGGGEFLREYFLDRINTINRLKNLDPILSREDSPKNQLELLIQVMVSYIHDENGGYQLEYETTWRDLYKDFKLSKEIQTQKLLKALVFRQISGHCGEEEIFWLDRLVQRFEVSKKLYNFYPSDFRKGYGRYQEVEHYLILAVVLCLHYEKVKKIKYLSTQLKLTDLLSSQTIAQFEGGVPLRALYFLICIEIENVRQLMRQQGVEIVY